MHRDPARVTAAVALALAIAATTACGVANADPVPTVEIRPETMRVEIPTYGDLVAARTTPIELPPTIRGMQRIAWLAPDGAAVKAGDLVARLDTDRIERQLDLLRNRMRKIDFQLEAKKQQLAKNRIEIESSLALLRQERGDALATAPRDAELFSRQEIIDAEINLELIETKIAHFESRKSRADANERTELEILRLQRETEMVQIQQNETARGQLEVRAPHDGFFLPGSTWQGEKIRVGMELWGGQPLGELPDLSEMEAKVWVLEAEAAGLAEGLDARVTLDAYPDVVLDAKVKTVQPIANPIERESPVKYFEVVLTLERTDPLTMKPGGQVRATIQVAEQDEALTVPNQAIFVEGGVPWLYVLDGGDFERREVELGQRSVSRTVITEGVVAGDRVALTDPTRVDVDGS